MDLGINVILHDSFSHHASQISNQFQDMQHSLSEFADVGGEIGKNMYQIWNGATLMMQGAAAALPAVFSVKEASRFEKQMAAIQTVWEHEHESASKQKRLLKDLGDQIKEMSLDIGTDSVETASGMYTILQANISDTSEALHLLELSQKSAIAGLTSTDAAADVLISIRNAYQLTADEMTETTDQIFKAIAVGKMSFEEFGRSIGKSIGIIRTAGMELPEYYSLKATATLSGMTASQADTGIRQALQEFMQPKEKKTLDLLQEMKDAGYLPKDFKWSLGYMEEQGGFHPMVSMLYDAAVKMEGSNSALKTTFKDGKDMKNTIEDIYSSGSIMGRLFNDMEGLGFVLNVVGDQGKVYDGVLKDITNSQGKLQESYQIMVDTLSHRWEKLVAGFKTLMISIGTPLLKMISVMVDGVTKAVTWMNSLIERVPILSYVFALLTLAISSALIALGAMLILAGVVGLATMGLQQHAISFLVTMRMSLLSTLGAFSSVLPFIVTFIGISYLLRKAWTENWGHMRETVMGFLKNLKMVFSGVKMLISTTEGHMGYLSRKMYENLQRTGMLDTVVMIYMWWYRIKTFWDGFIEGLSSAFMLFKTIIKGVADVLVPLLSWIVPLLEEAGKKLGLFKPSEDSVGEFKNMGRIIGALTGAVALFIGTSIGVKMVASAFSTVGGVVLSIGRALMFVGSLIGGFLSRFRFVQVLLGYAGRIGTFFSGMFTRILLQAGVFLTGLRAFLIREIPRLFTGQGLRSILIGLGQVFSYVIRTLIPRVIAGFAGASLGMIAGIVVAAGLLIWAIISNWDWLKHIPGFIGHMISELLQWIIALGLVALMAIYNTVTNAMDWLYEAMIDGAADLITGFADHILIPLIDSASEYFSYLGDVFKEKGVWGVVQAIYDSIPTIQEVFGYLLNTAGEWASKMGEAIADGFTNFFTGIIEKFNWLKDLLPEWAQKRITAELPKSNVNVPKLSTGGEISGTGMAILHPNEVVVNSPTLNRLKNFLANPLMNMQETEQAHASEDSTDTRQVDDLEGSGTTERRTIINAPYYAEKLASYQTPEVPDTSEGNMDKLISQMSAVLSALDSLTHRPVEVVSVANLDGREIYRSVARHSREEQARKY